MRPNLNAHHPWPGPVPALEAEGVSPSEDPLVLTPPRSERTRQVGVTVGPWGHYNPRPTNRKVAFKAATNLPTAFRRQQKGLLPREREPGHRFTGLFPSAAGQPSRHVGVGSRALRHPIPRVSPFRGFVANPLYPTPPEGLHSFGRISEKKAALGGPPAFAWNLRLLTARTAQSGYGFRSIFHLPSSRTSGMGSSVSSFPSILT